MKCHERDLETAVRVYDMKLWRTFASKLRTQFRFYAGVGVSQEN